MSVVRRSQPDIGSSSRNRFQIDGRVVQARGVRLALDPSIAGLESSLLRPLLAVVNFLPDKSGRDDRGRRLPTAQSDRNVLGESWGTPEFRRSVQYWTARVPQTASFLFQFAEKSFRCKRLPNVTW